MLGNLKTDNYGRTGIGNRKSVFKETTIPVMETFIINPLECNHTPRCKYIQRRS